MTSRRHIRICGPQTAARHECPSLVPPWLMLYSCAPAQSIVLQARPSLGDTDEARAFPASYWRIHCANKSTFL